MSTSMTDVSLGQIGQIAIPVRDIPRAVEFYRDPHGMRFLFQAPPGHAVFDAGGVRLMLDRPEKPEFAQHSSVIYYKVRDINATYAALKARGVDFIDEPHLIAKLPDHDLWMVFFRDPDENILALMCEVREKA
jgi:methylmalonyl-CoA/ethylmalonyl-CoA epimerase